MVKVPVGARVVIDLWDSKRRRGMVKYITTTMDLVRAESEFGLEKGDPAVVVKSLDSFVVVVPENEYTDIIGGKEFDEINYDRMGTLIYNILKERQEETGGILSFEELCSIFNRSTIQDLISEKHLKKAIKIRNRSYEDIKFHGAVYVVLKFNESSDDVKKVLHFAQDHAFVTVDLLQKDLGWSELRVERVLNGLLDKERVRVEKNYRTGNRYYFQNLNQ